MSLLDYYKDIEPFHARYDLESDRLKICRVLDCDISDIMEIVKE